ncbi:MAG TPA: hypothetical protein VM285_11295, partial [Polyangia bacterium]|nr:hypothetical protein [Polyangia bacterium]
MYGSFVTAQDYEGVQGFGPASSEQLNSLFKALRTGTTPAQAGISVVPGDGSTLIPESLDSTLKNVTYKTKNIVAWKQWDKAPAYSTAEEYSRLREYGNGVAAFIQQGELPTEDDASYSREVDIVKFMGTTRRVTHVMQVVRSSVGNLIAQETTNGTMWLLRQVEKALFYGNASLVPEEFDGLFSQLAAQLPSDNVLDMRGKPLNQEVVEEAAHISRAVPNFGDPSDLHLGDGAYSDLAASFFPTQRSQIPQAAAAPDGYVGFTVNGQRTQAGPIRFNPNVFIEPGRGPLLTGLGDAAKRPEPPTVSAASAGAPGGGEVSKFIASDAGDYRYQVAARNRHGYSAPVDVDGGAGVTVAAGQKVT